MKRWDLSRWWVIIITAVRKASPSMMFVFIFISYNRHICGGLPGKAIGPAFPEVADVFQESYFSVLCSNCLGPHNLCQVNGIADLCWTGNPIPLCIE